MDDVSESTSEHDVIIDGISNFQDSSHTFNKKAYNLKLGKNLQNNYSF